MNIIINEKEYECESFENITHGEVKSLRIKAKGFNEERKELHIIYDKKYYFGSNPFIISGENGVNSFPVYLFKKGDSTYIEHDKKKEVCHGFA